MSKSFSAILLILIISLMGAVGFLGYKVSDLSQRQAASDAVKMAASVDAEEVGQKLKDFEANLSDQGELLKQFSLGLTKISEGFERFASKKFIPAPELTLDPDAFAVKPGQAGDTIVADLASYSRWLKNNEMFLDYIGKKTLPLDYERATGNVVVKDLSQNSVFYQLGLRSGDKITSVDGKVMNKGPELREKILEAKDKQIVILRDTKKLTLTMQYRASDAGFVNLEITKEQFDEALPELLTSLKVVPVVQNGGEQGIEIIDIGPDNVFAHMTFKESDVLVSIDGDPINNKKMLSTLKAAGPTMEIEYLRGDVPGRVKVTFKQ